MPINPMTDLEEEDELTKTLNEYGAKKSAMDDASSGYDGIGALAGGLASLGAAFQGGNSIAAAQNAMEKRAQGRKDEATALDKWKQAKIDEIKAKREDLKVRESMDPNSSRSKSKADLIAGMYPSFAKYVTGKSDEQIAEIMPILAQKARGDEDRSLRAQEMRIRSEDRRDALEAKNEEKMMQLQTPYGLANTVEDAKVLKGAFESKKNFDSKVQEMIDLRNKHGGGAILDREDVARGKQLSKDLLLAYKDMAKLGVLSQADEKILNAIIPEDPLAYNSPLAAMQGQDPTLGRLEKFKGDSDRDFATRVKTRTRAGVSTAANEAPPPPPPGSKREGAIAEIERRRKAKQTAGNSGSW